MDVFDRMASIAHPEEEHLERYVMKLCTEAEVGEIEEHLLVCEDCHNRLHEAEEWVALMKMALPFGPRPARIATWRLSVSKLFARPMLAAGYAALAIALCAGPLWLSEQRGSDQLVNLTATRGGADLSTPMANSRNRIRLRIDTTDLDGPLEAEIVDAAGVTVWVKALRPSDSALSLNQKLQPGSYWVRVNSATDHRTLRETGLLVQ